MRFLGNPQQAATDNTEKDIVERAKQIVKMKRAYIIRKERKEKIQAPDVEVFATRNKNLCAHCEKFNYIPEGNCIHCKLPFGG